jgi:hypothetical protein
MTGKHGRRPLRLRLALALLALYPRAYRARYGEELRALLEDYPVTAATLLDLSRSALEAQLRPGALLDSPPKRMRGTVSAAVALWIALVFVGSGFAKTTEDASFRAAEAAHPLLGGARDAVAVLALASGVIVAVAGAPLAFSVLRQAWRGQSRSLRRAVAVPLVALACFCAASAALVLLANHGPRGGSLLGRVLIGAWLALAVVVAAACALGARRAIQGARLRAAELALAVAGAWLLARVMAALTATTALYATLLAVYAQRLEALPNGPFPIATSVSVASQVAAMAAISAFALVSARRGLRSARS